MQDTLSELATIKRDPQTSKLNVPRSRLTSAAQARCIFDRLAEADIQRSKKRALVRGLVDGNPPYKQSLLRAEGRDYQCNVNWRIAESYFNAAIGAFYDIFSESPTYATVKLKLPEDDQREYKSRCVTEHFDWLLRSDKCFDYHMSVSQNEMVLFGRGPLVFDDEFDWKPTSVLDGAVRVPDRTRSDTELWELVTVEVEYQCDRLYAKIEDGSAARIAGWNVDAVKQSIINAFPKKDSIDKTRNWEYYQQQLKQDALGASYQANTVRTVHLFYKEFNGRISHKIIVADSGQEPQSSGTETPQEQFLFEKENRYDSFDECIHAMYYDHGGGGFHHSVTGMGVKMYAAVEYQNRLLCNLADKAFTPKVMFKPTNAGQSETFALQQFGEYAVLSDGFDMLQTPIHGVMEEGLVFNREVTGVVSSNLSQYRQNLQEPKSGNPITAREVEFKAGEQARLGKTQLNRYYKQLDGLYAEMYRRATQKPVSGAAGADQIKEFQARCAASGVALEELRKVESVKATRIVGQGSEFTRQQALSELFIGVLPMLPEDGRTNLIDDVIASRTGQHGVNRYNPKRPQDKPTDQHAVAWGQVADMKIGVPAVVTSTQNPVIFAQVFLQAGAQAAQSLEQGANMADVAAFLELDGQAIAAHLSRLQGDPSRKQILDLLSEQFQKLAKIHDALTQRLEQDAQAQAQQMQERMQAQQQATAIRTGRDPQTMIKAAETDAKIRQQQQKTNASIAMKAQKHAQNMALADAQTAATIQREANKPKNGES